MLNSYEKEVLLTEMVAIAKLEKEGHGHECACNMVWDNDECICDMERITNKFKTRVK